MRRKLHAMAATALACGFHGAPAWAQVAQPPIVSNDAIADIVVTANRRSELSQSVPAAITAFSPEQLKEQNVRTSQDLLGLVPSLLVGPVGTYRNTESVTIRGQGSTFGAAPGVITYFAEVAGPQNSYTQQQGVGMFYDLANVQVLKGPQGTLFGKNTTGGAVLVEPQRPVDGNEGYFQVSAGNYNMREVETAINVAVVPEKLLVRAAFWGSWRDGFTREVNSGADLDNRSRYSARLGITYAPTESISNYLLLYYYDADESITGRIPVALNPTFFPTNAVAPNTGGLTYGQIIARQAALGPRRVSYNVLPFDVTRSWGIIDHLNIELSDELTLRNVISYSRLKNSFTTDEDGTIAQIGGGGGIRSRYPTNVEQGTEELQLQGRLLNGDLNFTVGGYADFHRPVAEQDFAGAGQFFTYVAHPSERRKSQALFSQFTYDFGNASEAIRGLRFTGGFRYTWDQRRNYSDFLQAIYANFGLVIPALSGRASSAEPSWTVGLDYQITTKALTYAKVSRGFKAGGFSNFAASPVNATFLPEFVTTYEAGLKSDWMIGSMPLRLNIAGYYTDYKDLQRSGGDFDPLTFAAGSATYNAGSATIKGIEVEAALQPFRGLALRGSYSRTWAKYKTYDIPIVGPTDGCQGTVYPPGTPGAPVGAQFGNSVDLSCIPFANVPKHQLSATARYETELSPTLGSLAVSATLNHTSRQSAIPTSLPSAEPFGFLPSFTTLNLSAELKDVGGLPVDISAFATNVTNKTYRISTLPLYSTSGYVVDVYGEPRMYGLRLRYRWGN